MTVFMIAMATSVAIDAVVKVVWCRKVTVEVEAERRKETNECVRKEGRMAIGSSAVGTSDDGCVVSGTAAQHPGAWNPKTFGISEPINNVSFRSFKTQLVHSPL